MNLKNLFFIKFSYLFLFLTLNSHASNTLDLSDKLDNIYFDVVEKKISFSHGIPKEFEKYLLYWFENRIKLNGIEGLANIKILKYFEDELIIDKKKRIEITMAFEIDLIKKSKVNSKKIIYGEVFSFGEISGRFSLDDFDKIIDNARKDLILKMNNKLIENL